MASNVLDKTFCVVKQILSALTLCVFIKSILGHETAI